jgi:cytochrome c5
MRRLGGILWILVSGCAQQAAVVPVMDSRMAEASGVPLVDLRRGNALYVSKCGRCHELIAPKEVKTADWHLVLPGMCWNAGLEEADEKQIMKYILAAKSR